MRYRSWIFCLLISANSLLAEDTRFVAERSEWPQWRGPDRNGLVGGLKWPAKLSGSASTKIWSKSLGPSYSGPLVIGDQVFVTETQDAKLEMVRALRRDTGEQIWETGWPGAMRVPFFARANGDWIRATPAYSDGRLYVAGMQDLLVCVDSNSGKKLWETDFAKIAGANPAFGFVSSPLVMGNFVYVQAGGSFVKIEKSTGQIAWQVLKDGGGMNGGAFSSPYFAKIAGREQIVVQTRESLNGVDAETGSVLWTQPVKAFRGMNILTPVVVNDHVFTSSYGGGSYLYHITSRDGRFQSEENYAKQLQGYMSTPVVIDGYVYMHLKNQRFSCMNVETGEEKWRSKPFGKYWSLVAQGDRILALDERGMLYLIKANPEKLEILDELKVSEEPTWAHLGVCDDQIFVRGLNSISVFRWTPHDQGIVPN